MLSRYYEVDVKKLESLLVQKGWAAREIARRGAISQRRVDQIMQGGRVFRTTLKRLADVLGVEPEEIVKSGPLRVVRDESEAATFNVNLSNVPSVNMQNAPEEFDETSPYVHNFLYVLNSKIGCHGDVVDYIENGDKVTITVEIDRKVLVHLFNALFSGAIRDVKPGGEPGTIQPGASMYALLLWWVEDIEFPDDCPFEMLRGKVVTARDDFILTMP